MMANNKSCLAVAFPRVSADQEHMLFAGRSAQDPLLPITSAPLSSIFIAKASWVEIHTSQHRPYKDKDIFANKSVARQQQPETH